MTCRVWALAPHQALPVGSENGRFPGDEVARSSWSHGSLIVVDMALSEITKSSVLQAIAEFDQLGREAFLAKYGFGPAHRYFLLYDGVAYDSKAICGAAHGFLGDGFSALGSSQFSGGEKRVGVVLSNLGFAVVSRPRRLSIGKGDGSVFKAECEIRRSGNGFVLTMLSRGGKKGADSERNPDYLEALRVLLSRLSRIGAELSAVVLDTDRTRFMPVDERQLVADTPFVLSPNSSVDDLAAEITKTASSLPAGKLGKGGNPTKQIQIHFSSESIPDIETAYSQILNGGTNVFVLTWNPSIWPMTIEEIEKVIEALANGEPVQWQWSTGSRKSGINPGDRVVLLRQGTSDRGIVAVGTAMGAIYEDVHFADESKTANYVDVAWSDMVLPDERLTIEDLEAVTTSTNWDSFYGSGRRLADADAIAVLGAWNAMNPSLTMTRTGDEGVAGLPEGAKKSVTVNRYERSQINRRKCLEAHGAACAVCNIDFGVFYGNIGEGFIHVHHVTPVSAIGTDYVVNPVTDLVPVCPNCHAMLHRGVSVPRTVDQLRALLKQ